MPINTSCCSGCVDFSNNPTTVLVTFNTAPWNWLFGGTACTPSVTTATITRNTPGSPTDPSYATTGYPTPNVCVAGVLCFITLTYSLGDWVASFSNGTVGQSFSVAANKCTPQGTYAVVSGGFASTPPATIAIS